MYSRHALLLVAAALCLAPVCAVRAAGLEIRFCPEQTVRPYPLDSLRGVQGLLLQNAAVVNAGDAPVTLRALDIELLRDGAVVDRRRLDAATLAAAAQSGKGLQDQGMVEVIAFQFCDGRLLQQRKLAASATLAPGEALLIMQQVFAWKGTRDELRVRALSDVPEAAASLRIDPGTSHTIFRWPLSGGPWTIAGASFHGTHRWGVPEEFALDIVKAGGDGRTYRDGGKQNSQFHAYGADVLAAADGVVSSVITGATELAPLLRESGESMQDYFGRVGAQQARNMAEGDVGIAGESVVLDHGDNEYSVYAHLKPGSVRVKPGDKATAGQVIGQLGSSGNSTEPHLHFQVCDRPNVLLCAALIPSFDRIEIANSDGPRPLQNGDVVIAGD
jgi:murein DD-endopeptidase MepM/ murein hydrolase activator NlpD